jgi:hypothetical protein
LPFTPVIFVFTYWFSKQISYYAIAGGAIVSSYFFLGAINTGALVILIAAYIFILSAFKKTPARIFATILLTAVLAILRIGFINLPLIPLAVPVVGSMIMFRYVLMLYEHHYGSPQSTWIQKFTYLVLPPALAFPLFPIVDYKSFLNNHRPQDSAVIRTGLTRIAAGLVFMMTYRILYLYFIPGYVEVHDALSAFTYTVCNYLYILNVFGVMWIAVGYLGLLGFDLPQVFNYVFLIDNFRDIWRRINVYWRDFMVKLVYYPLYFKLRKKTKAAILITSLTTLTISAMLHGWQWFWLQGTFVLHAPGIIFWCVIGLVISINLAMQNPVGTAPPKKLNPSIRALRITGMFLFMCFMWSLWNSSSVSEWVNLLSYYKEGTLVMWLIIATVLTGIYLLHYFIQRLPAKPAGHHILNKPYHPALIIATCGILILPVIPNLTGKITGSTGEFLVAISKARLSDADQSAATENYYNRMLASDGMGSRPWEVHTPGRDAQSGLDDACVRSENLLVRELIPNKVTVLDGWTISTNSFGMRDQEYSLGKPEGTYRIAILGASYEMGSGVAQDSTFEALLEEMLNDTFTDQKIEILNFAVGGYHLPQLVWVAENKLPQFQPDLVLCFVHPADAARTSEYMANMVRNGIDLHYPALYKIRKEAGAEQHMEQKVLVNRFYPFNGRIAEWSLMQIKIACEGMNAFYGTVYLPSLGDSDDSEFYRSLYDRNAHPQSELTHNPFFFDLTGIYGQNPKEYALDTDPTHPNTEAHSNICTELARQLAPVLRNIRAHQPHEWRID